MGTVTFHVTVLLARWWVWKSKTILFNLELLKLTVQQKPLTTKIFDYCSIFCRVGQINFDRFFLKYNKGRSVRFFFQSSCVLSFLIKFIRIILNIGISTEILLGLNEWNPIMFFMTNFNNVLTMLGFVFGNISRSK